MNRICNGCQGQRSDNRGSVECGKAYYEDDEYGHFKRGCTCVYDKDLIFQFEPREDMGEIKRQSKHIERLEKEAMKYRDKIRILKNRLTKIEEE